MLAIAVMLSSCSSMFHPAPSTLPPDSRLHRAVVDNDVEKVAKLVNSPFCNINKKSRGRTALAYAVSGNNYEIAKLLLVNGAAPDIPTSVTGLSPIHDAALKGNLDIVKLLVEHGSNPQLKGAAPNVEWTPISAAESNSHHDVVEYLQNIINNKKCSD